MNNRNLFLLGLFFIFSSNLVGQTIPYDQEYQLAKTDFENQDYTRAAQRFKSLLARDPANEKSAYVAYYYGISSYEVENPELARDIFQELLKNNKDWNKISEAQLWLAKIYYELENPLQGTYYTELASKNSTLTNDIRTLKESYYQALDSVSLRSIMARNADDRLAAKYLAMWQVKTPSYRKNFALLDSLIVHYQLDSVEIGLAPPPDVFKDRYKVAVLLPLFAERLWHSGIYLQKSLAVDIYEGLQLALEEIDTTKIAIEVFDTQRDSVVTHNILASGQLADADAILGPLYPDPITLVANYAKEEKINFLNPVTTNSGVMVDNQFAFLLRSGDESIGRIVADYTRANIDTGAFAVYYGPRRTDSLTAFNYASLVQQDSFYLAIRQRTSTSEARQIFDSLTSSVQVIDSVKLEEMLEAEEEVRFKPLMDSLLLKVDSLGHIFIASDNQAIASEVMAAVAYRGDTTQLIGVGNWYSVPNAGLDLMESLNVWLAMHEFENMLSAENLAIADRYRTKYLKKPSKYVFYGYYGIKFLSNALMNYGVYFQNGFKSKGNLDPRFDFRKSQDNQQMVLYRLQDGLPLRVRKNELPISGQ